MYRYLPPPRPQLDRKNLQNFTASFFCGFVSNGKIRSMIVLYRSERNKLPIVLPEHQFPIFSWAAAALNDSVGLALNTSTMRSAMAGCFSSCLRASWCQNAFSILVCPSHSAIASTSICFARAGLTLCSAFIFSCRRASAKRYLAVYTFWASSRHVMTLRGCRRRCFLPFCGAWFTSCKRKCVLLEVPGATPRTEGARTREAK